VKKLTRFFAAAVLLAPLRSGIHPGQWEASRFWGIAHGAKRRVGLGRRSSVAEDVLETMHRHHPEERHRYLPFIGSDPTVRGAGLMLSNGGPTLFAMWRTARN
jgi:hypothetical protein